jgi:hypothetical protein
MDKKYDELLILANKILENSSYSYFKNIIYKYFNWDNKNLDNIISRLIMIDSLYSTNMSKRLYWLEDLRDFILKLEKDHDIDNLTIEDFNKSILNKIIKEKLWIRKNWMEVWHALSLITKYLYFRKNYDFPIYDSLVENQISKKWFINKKDYFTKLEKLKSENNLKFDDLDKILWLSWKLKKWSFSWLLKNKDTYIIFIKELWITENTKVNDTQLKEKFDTINSEHEFILDIKNFLENIKSLKLI